MAEVKLDNSYNSLQYQLNLQKAEELGFKGLNAANFALNLTALNLLYETELPELIVTPGVKRKYIVDDGTKNIHFAPHTAAHKESDISKIAAGAIGIPMAATYGLGVLGPMTTLAGIGSTVSNGVKTGFDWMGRFYTPSKWVEGAASYIPKFGKALNFTRTFVDPAVLTGFMTGATARLGLKSINGTLGNNLVSDVLDASMILGPAIGKTKKVINGAKTLAKLYEYPIRSWALNHGTNFTIQHPGVYSKLLPIVKKISPLADDAMKVLRYDLSVSGPQDLAIKNGIIFPTNTKLNNGEWIFNDGLYIRRYPDIVQAIKEKRYTPFMTVSEKKLYLEKIKDLYSEGSNFVNNFNKNHILNHQRDLVNNAYRAVAGKFSNPKYNDLVYRYTLAANDAMSLGITQGTNKKKLFLIGNKYNISPDQIRLLSKEVFTTPIIAQHIQKARENIQFLPFRAPKLKLVNHPLEKEFGHFSAAKNEIVLSTTPIKRHVLGQIKGNYGLKHVIGHELDHAAQEYIPKVRKTTVYDPVSKYYTAQIYPNESGIWVEYKGPTQMAKDFPELMNLKNLRGWESSPHEWRSEFVGYAFDNNLSNEYLTWPLEAREGYHQFMNERFSEANAHLPYGKNVGDLVRRMFRKGYKSGGKLNYLDYVG